MDLLDKNWETSVTLNNLPLSTLNWWCIINLNYKTILLNPSILCLAQSQMQNLYRVDFVDSNDCMNAEKRCLLAKIDR